MIGEAAERSRRIQRPGARRKNHPIDYCGTSQNRQPSRGLQGGRGALTLHAIKCQTVVIINSSREEEKL